MPGLTTPPNSGTLVQMKSVTRLYQNFQPSHYNLALDIDPEAMTFTGIVEITGKKVGRPSQRITLHQKDLKITAAKITRHDKKGSEEKNISRINPHKTYDEVRLHSPDMLFPGEYTIELEFSGHITEPMNGIYPCLFEVDGKEKKLIATQFESHHAREVFPCVDEPEAKSTFDLKLVTPKGQTVLANTPVKSQKAKKTRQESTFETTPKMSTYLLAFVFGDMEYLEATTKDGVQVRTYATANNVAFTQFALDTAVKCLEFYNEYFGIPYPLAKCDMVALPDFASGAMENWGLITYREQALIVDPKNTSLGLKQYVAMVVAHELAHQWFGNLVTMRWWTDLWLNEGFATWIEYLATDKQHPDWQMWTQFIVDEQQPGMKLDALKNTHAIEVPVHHPDEIRTIFDTISYSKGAAIIHMLHNYLGADTFRDGLRYYLKQHTYGNTDTTDLWHALGHISGKPVQAFMNAWTSQPGYPIVQVSLDQPTPQLKQERFYLGAPDNRDSVVWPVPLLAGSTFKPESIAVSEQDIKASKLPDDLLINQGRAGFYRVVYDPKHVGKLAKLVASGKLDVLDRLGLLSDSFEAAKAGYASTVDSLRLLEAYSNEDDNAVWDIIAGNLGSIRAVMNDETVREALKPYMRKLTTEQLKRLGWEAKSADSHFDQLLRPTILGMSSLAEESSVVKEALGRFESMTEPEDIHPDLRGVVYGTAVRHGDAQTFDKLFSMHETSKNSEERVTLAAALTGFKQEELIKRALTLITSKSVRLQDAPYWIAYSFGNRHARDVTWQWLKENWDWLEAKLGNDLSFYRMPNYAARAYSDTKFLNEFKEFFDSHMSPAFDRPVKQAIETVEWQAAWRSRDLKPIQNYLKK